MNSQFKNSNLGFILYASIIGLIVAATIFVIWYMTTGYRIGTYEPDTRLGSVYIGGLTEDEVIPRLDQKIAYWYNDDTIVFELKYQDYSYEFNRDLIYFDSDASTYNIQQGEINEIVVYYQGSDREVVVQEITDLQFLENVIENIDLTLLVNDILYDVSLMKSFSSKNVEDYLIDMELSVEELGTSSFRIPEGVEIDDLIEVVDDIYADGKVIISSKELFDIIEIFGNDLNDAEMTVLASAMLELVLETSFLVNEVHYEPNIDFAQYTVETFPYFARNTVINRVVNESFSFYNPNESDYYFTIEKIDEFSGIMVLHGLPFVNNISITITKTEVAYITQSTNDIALLQSGFNGVIIEVVRVVTDIDGVVIYNKVILFEFYPPIKEIIFEP
jgi:hypothetical protein